MKKRKDGNVNIYCDELGFGIYENIKGKNYKTKKVLKDDKRSYVAIIEIENKKYVYKEPREKNKRKWQRFLSIFRGSESYREYMSIKKIRDMGFNAPTPYLAVEEKKFMMVYNSYYIAEYIDGREGSVKNIDIISNTLREIHNLGYLHGDSHIANFLIKENDVYIIDTKFIKNKYGNCGKIFEFIYLEESCNKDIFYDKKSIYYKIAMILKRYLIWLGNFKKKLRGK